MLPKLDATWWKTGQMTRKQLMDTLEQGNAPTGNVACVTTKDAVQFRALAETHQIEVDLALVLVDLPTGTSDHSFSNASVQWVRLVGGRWKFFLVVPLCSNLPNWSERPDVKKVDKIPQNGSLSTFRVVFNREFLTPIDWNSTVKKPTDTLMKSLPEGVSARAYGWHVNNSSKEEAVIGFFKAPVADGASIIQRSGWKHGFYQRLEHDAPKEREPIKWLLRGERLPSAYLAEARALAKKHKVGLVLRRGGRNNLGLLGIKPDEDDSKRRRRWAVKGVPNGWGPVDFSQVLNGQGFEAFGDVTPPGHKGGIWTFKAVWSGSGNASCKVLEIGAAKPLVISPWLPAPLKKPFTEPLWGAKGWITRAQSAEEDAEMPECPATLTDETQQSQPEASQGQSNKKGPDGSSNGSPEKKKVRTSGFAADKKTKVMEDLDKLGPDGVPQWDLGGFGDCGFRCLVAAQSLRNGKKKEDVVQNIAKLALSFRTKTTLFLAQHDSWHQSWFADPEATEVTEGGDVPTDVSSYLQACKRNNKWFDSFNCFAAAEVLESEVVVFKHLHGQWVYFQKFVPSKCSSKEPIPLFLKNGHFQTIDPSVPLPSHWHDFDPKDVGPALCFLGGGKRACAGGARVSSTKSAKTGKSDSLSSWFKPQSAKTVKKQVLRSQKASGSAHGSGLTDASPAGSSWFRPQKVTTKKKEKQVPGAARSSGRSLKASSAAFSKWFRPQKQANPSGSGGQQHSLARAVCPALQEDKDTIAADLPLLDDLLANRRRRQKPLKEPCVWICPTCKLRLEHKTSTGLSQKKLNHVKSRHPNIDQTSLRDPRKKVPYALTKELPPEQLVWACPICGAGHPALPNQEHKRAVAHHIKQFHPKETPPVPCSTK